MARKDDDLDMNDEAYMEDDANMEDDNDSEDGDESSSKKVAADAGDDDSTGSALERQRLRESLAAEVEAFLARGGQIQEIEANVMADPPRKPQTSYGSRPI